MTISCFPKDEAQLRFIVDALKDAGLFSQYEEQAHGEHILLSVHTRSIEDRERVQGILQETGVSELIYTEDQAA